jgi:3-oxoacyl-[acyl-carrier protein] reductase
MRTVIISGASSGIGKATAERFARDGDCVVNLDISPQPTDSPAQWIETDISDWGVVSLSVAQAVAEHGGIDVVVANAGISVRHGVLDITEAEARRVLEVDLLGVLALWRHAAEHMIDQESGGVLLATASVNGLRGYPYYADYNAAKAGIVALCRTFAIELSPRIRTACVSPGAVLTAMQLAEYSDDMLDATNSAIPFGRHADPAEIAEIFYFLASPAAAFLTGQEIVVDGGETLGATTAVFGTGGRTDRQRGAPG